MRRVRVFSDQETPPPILAEVRRFVCEAFDGGFSEEDWNHSAGGWRVVLLDGDLPISHAAVVPRDLRVGERTFHAGYVEAVATAKAAQQQGYGSAVMRRVTHVVQSRFELGALSTSRRSFYRRFGWDPWRGPSYVYDEGRLVRTPDEDDGLMVLRFGPSAGVDLTSAITCESRAADDW